MKIRDWQYCLVGILVFQNLTIYLCILNFTVIIIKDVNLTFEYFLIVHLLR